MLRWWKQRQKIACQPSPPTAASGKHKFVAPEGLPTAWLAEGFDWKVDRGLTSAEIEEAEGVVTGSFCGIADSGTIVLHHSAIEGRRVLSLLPDWHLIVLHQPGSGDAAGVLCALRAGANIGHLHLRAQRYGRY
jgi:hypothetical protein